MANSSSFYQGINPTPAASASLASQVAAAQAAAASASASAASARASAASVTGAFGTSMAAFIAGLPTSNPHAYNKVWKNGESLSVSTG